jgi:hypothetical protein
MFGISAYSETPFASLAKVGISGTLTGVSTITGLGTLGVDRSEQFSNTVATGNVGTVVFTITPAITGVESASGIGTVIYNLVYYANATGVSSTVSAGSTFFARAAILAGNAASVSAGTIPSFEIGKNITGVQAAGQIGTFTSYYWSQIDDTQIPHWVPITTF